MKTWICAICALIGLTANAKVKLPAFFADNMVLQQQSECNIWGWAEPGKRVNILTTWDKKSYMLTARKDGYFDVKVKTPEAGGPYMIVFRDGDGVILNNVMIGEVWICAGQSNMEMQMKGFKQQPVEGTTEELLHCKDSLLRLFTVKRHASLTPVDECQCSRLLGHGLLFWQGSASGARRSCGTYLYKLGRFCLRGVDECRLVKGIPQGTTDDHRGRCQETSATLSYGFV